MFNQFMGFINFGGMVRDAAKNSVSVNVNMVQEFGTLPGPLVARALVLENAGEGVGQLWRRAR